MRPSPMQRAHKLGLGGLLLLPLLLAGLTGCGESTGTPGGLPAPVPTPAATPADFPGTTNTVPTTPATGTSRAGQIYDVYIQSPKTGDKVAFTVFEPSTITGGQTYPLILQSHGFAGSRDTASSMGNVGPYIAKGYGAISIDERGHGESGGTIRVMDPDAEGQNLLAILDWAEAKLPWLAYGRSADGSDPHNLVLGSMGGSYGGMYQFLIHNIDPKRRLDAMTPEIAPNNLNFALFPGTVAKTTWNLTLFGAGNTAGSQGGSAANFDPFIRDNFATGLIQGTESDAFKDFFYYHSNEYFCGSGQTVATNGGPGTAPGYAPVQGSKVNILFYQGIRDTLFNLTDGIKNYECAVKQGGDVRFLSYLTGHNALQVAPDPGLSYLGGPQAQLDDKCGTLAVDTARLAFFEQHLKGVAGAANAIPTKPCFALAPGSAVLVDHILHASGSEGTEVDLPSTNLVAGNGLNVPVPVTLGITGAAGGTLVAGVPHVKITVTPTVPVPGSPTVFLGLGRTHNGVPNVYDLVDNMVMPITGSGEHEVDLVAVATLLAEGDQLVLLAYGLQDQFAVTGTTATQAPLIPVSISGKLRLPIVNSGSYTMAP